MADYLPDGYHVSFTFADDHISGANRVKLQASYWDITDPERPAFRSFDVLYGPFAEIEGAIWRQYHDQVVADYSPTPEKTYLAIGPRTGTPNLTPRDIEILQHGIVLLNQVTRLPDEDLVGVTASGPATIAEGQALKYKRYIESLPPGTTVDPLISALAQVLDNTTVQPLEGQTYFLAEIPPSDSRSVEGQAPAGAEEEDLKPLSGIER